MRVAEESPELYHWPRTLWNRPVLLWFVVFVASLTLILGMAAVGLYGP
jgi:hypothetical protein